jgi:hypothetical protein
MSYAGEVIADSSGKWCANQLRFATREEARLYVSDLASRWTLVTDTRVVESGEPVNYYWDDDAYRARPLVKKGASPEHREREESPQGER